MFPKQRSRWQRWLYLLIFLTGLIYINYEINAQDTPNKNPSQTAILLEIKGGIGPATQEFIRNGLAKAAEQQAQVVILQIDTPGGLSKSMRGIIKAILASPVPVITYVAPSGARAASAGTYILYASHVAAMAPGTNLGAATPVSIGGAPGPGRTKEKEGKNKTKKPSAAKQKALNDARAYIRSLAQLRHRNVKWAEQAVTKAESLSAEEAVKLNVVNFIAKNISALLQKADGMKVNVQGQIETLHTSHLTLKHILPGWRSKFLAVITDPSVAYILLMIGFYGLFFEFANPGFIVPGVVGGIALLLALYAFQLLPINYAGLALILLGIVFIIAEAFVPSFGALGIGGVISFVIGSILLLKTDMLQYRIPLYLVIIVSVVSAAFFLLVLNMALRSHRRPVVSGSESVVGQRGKITISNGIMWTRIHGERWQCKSDTPLQEGQEIIVKAVSGLTLIVEPIDKKET